MSLVTMNRESFYSLGDEKLGSACMEPTFMQIRGKSPVVKAEVISQLTRGQQALCMFRVMYGHSYKSAAEYYAWISYMLSIPGYWERMMGGVRFFDEPGMGALLEETRGQLEARNSRLKVNWGDATLMDTERDDELMQMVKSWFDRFEQVAPSTHSIIAKYIRSHPEEFVLLAD
jgi:hypothetical protein